MQFIGKFTKWLSFGIVLACIPLSVVLIIANLSLGFMSAGVFIASLLAAVGVALLIPKTSTFIKVLGVISLVAAIILMGIVCFMTGGFPVLNLLFI